MNSYYRISNNSYKKNRLPHATKEHCLDNFIAAFGKYPINLIADNVTEPSLMDFIKSKESDLFKIEHTKLNNAHAFRHAMRRACNELKDNEFVYFVEDDYLHLPNSADVLLEGLKISDYACGYDHPDKYINGSDGGNPQVEGGGEVTRLVMTPSHHWKLTNSTTCTWATNIKTLKEDMDVFEAATVESYPQDYWAFCQLIQGKGRSLISSVPGICTHSELPWLSPLIDWTKI